MRSYVRSLSERISTQNPVPAKTEVPRFRKIRTIFGNQGKGDIFCCALDFVIIKSAFKSLKIKQGAI